mmetsp:Transcript_12998/g.25311  ORF Transcript_12998/g.25311 Transcript_12998/m.25311 type:complete len:832 (+) Transcript_12998:115-2610(+)
MPLAQRDSVVANGFFPHNNISSHYYNPQTSWRRCDAKGSYFSRWIMCLGSQGEAISLCPVDEQFREPPYLKMTRTYHSGSEVSFQPCFQCPELDSIYGHDCATSIKNMTQIFDLTVANASSLLDMCTKMCDNGFEGDYCSVEEPCSAYSHFCDFSDAQNDLGVCQKCPKEISDCYGKGFITSEAGRRNCVECEPQCDDVGWSTLIVEEKEIPSDFMHLAIQESYLAASGPITDCSDLVRHSVDKCIGAGGKVCLVDVSTRHIKYRELSQKAENSGCVAIILNATYNNGRPIACGSHSYDELGVPFICISNNNTNYFQKDAIGKTAAIEVNILGQACHNNSNQGTICSENVPCASKNEFCPFDRKVVNGDYEDGWCDRCPIDGNGNPVPLSCYFDFSEGYARDSKYVIDCVKSCDAQIKFGSCKFCPDGLNAIDFDVAHGDEKCHFCPNYDVRYPDRLFPLFGDNITCWQMQAFYESVDIDKNSQNCALAQKMNYICGCEGLGYAGASTESKQALLVWLPRAMAILSMFGSSFIVFDALRTKRKRGKLLNQMLSTLSLFDILGSIAYAFTTLPTPDSDYLYGSKGNKKTCLAQGFFIQIGTIACFLNVSISMYYLLTIKYGWKHEKLNRKRAWFFFPPIVIGLVFAFVGIPFYDNLFLWCNNSARYWPEIPVILAIVFATVIMCTIAIDVRKKSHTSARHSLRRKSMALSRMVFKQALWFTGAFYVTWVPYLAMQYMWTTGTAFYVYGFILYAASSVPLQGFWNFVVYVRPRYLNDAKASRLTAPIRSRATTLRTSIGRLSSSLRHLVETKTGRHANPVIPNVGELDRDKTL